MLALPQPLGKLIAQTLYDGSIKLDQFQWPMIFQEKTLYDGSIKLDQFQWPMIFQEEMQSDIYEQLRTTSLRLHNSAGQF